MKGVIAIALKQLVVEKFGEDKWQEALKSIGIKTEPIVLPISNIDDELVLKIIGSVCNVLNISLEQAADAFGDYWVNEYAPKTYNMYYKFNNAKDFLLSMDNVHLTITKSMEGARPPHFKYEWKDDKTLIMSYRSHRGLIEILIGLIKGVGKYFNENLGVKKIDNNNVEIVFP